MAGELSDTSMRGIGWVILFEDPVTERLTHW